MMFEKRARGAILGAAAVSAVVLAAALVASCSATPTGKAQDTGAAGKTASPPRGVGATGAPGGGATTSEAGQADLEAAVKAFVTERSSISPDQYDITYTRTAKARNGDLWAIATITPKSKDLDSAIAILKQTPAGAWKGVEFGTGMDGSVFPPEVRPRLWPPGE